MEQGWIHEERLDGRVGVAMEMATCRGRTERSRGWVMAKAGAKETAETAGGTQGHPDPPATPLLSTSRVTKTSAEPVGLLALQMYWPESCCAARGMTKLPFTTRCCQGRGARSFDHSIRGAGSPTGDAGAHHHGIKVPRQDIPSLPPSSSYLWLCSAAWRCPRPPR